MLKLEERVKLVRSLRSRNEVDKLPDPVVDLEIQKGGFRYACSLWSTKFGWSKPTCDTCVVHFAGAAEKEVFTRNLKQPELQRLKNRGKKG